jgi:hypothetical protein
MKKVSVAEQPTIESPKRKYNKKPKSEPKLSVVSIETVEVENLKSEIIDLRKENERLQKLVSLASITSRNTLVECTNDDIDLLYLKYLTENLTSYNNAKVLKIDNKAIIPKSYYEIRVGE